MLSRKGYSENFHQEQNILNLNGLRKLPFMGLIILGVDGDNSADLSPQVHLSLAGLLPGDWLMAWGGLAQISSIWLNVTCRALVIISVGASSLS